MTLTRSFLENIIGDKGTVEQILKNQEIANHVNEIGEENCEMVDREYLKKITEDVRKLELARELLGLSSNTLFLDNIYSLQEKAGKYSKILKWAEKGEIHNIHFVLHNYKKMSDQSLKNQKDAEIFREFGDITKKEIYQEYWKNYKIVERLKKRIELHKQTKKDLEEAEKDYLDIKLSNKVDMFKACQEDMLNELQKILEGKKEVDYDSLDKHGV